MIDPRPFHPQDKTAVPGKLLTFGESMGLISQIGLGTLDFAEGIRISIGGAESNVAIGAARLGTDVTWIGRIGRDAVGDLVESRLKSAGVSTFAIRDSSYTGLMVRHQRNAVVSSVDYHRAGSAGSHLSPLDITAEVIQRFTLMHVSGITSALSETARECVTNAVGDARRLKVTISVDVNYRAKLWDSRSAHDVMNPLVSNADIVFAGVDEAQLVLGTTIDNPSELARGLAELGPSEVIIKEGERGCTALIDGLLLRQAALAVPVVDPVGAGDAFVAGYLSDRLNGESSARCLQTAVAMGSYAVTVPGDCELLPNRVELEALSSESKVQR